MKTIGVSPSRRAFLRTVTSVAPAAVAVGGSMMVSVACRQDAGDVPYRPKFFAADEWDTLVALVDRLIPADSEGPGSVEAGVAEFIDLQMNTAYGYGGLWYMHGPFIKAPPTMGYQLPFSPRDMYRNALRGLQEAMRKQYGKRFEQLENEEKDQVIGELETGKIDIGTVPPHDFFTQLLQNTREGYFCDPKHGGNKGMAAWRMINFPGARADYIDWVEQYGRRYPLAPVSSA
ncbi:gluconate 2-dehydrogenase [Paraburkholderia phytofirmans OLGA172]|uniref:Gluconate 2-dehydrogenase n=1 Tax=Paraburkholderia phytofirmans OLGA172 TaxID=1417228 RepID=A0A160FTK7_9BURK|nr:gluconate 2-dehydrogenase subunit 3 family protein [Paraburkholderia phytofirmans]ANB76351.1 gluconate 2-dehydrogenase [Paraburkholderia phytofirmans OLGA172]